MALAIKKGYGRRTDVDMTQGGIARNIISFAFPLMVGNLFQQLYNMVDTWVIGQTGINSAFAAVGSVGPIINILIGFFLGLSSGAGVVISQYYGAKNYEKVKESVHTAISLTLILAVFFTVVGLCMSPLMLKLMLRSEDSSVYPHALQYLMIYFSGVSGLMFYNITAGIMRAVGDSRRPFYFLIVSSVINIVLDLVFVFGFSMGVAGVALATIIAQFASAILGILSLLKTDSCIKLDFRELKLSPEMLKKIIKIGIPAGLQMAITAFSNVFVQSYIANVNMDSTIALSGWTAYSKIDMFIFLPTQSIALAVTTFVGQNIGINNEKRARKGTYTAMGIAACITAAVIAIVMFFSPVLVKIFNSDPDVVACGTLLLRYITPFYMFTCVNQILAAALRGAGNSTAPMIIMISSFVGFRQLYLYLVSNYISNDLIPIAMGYPAGWGICALTIFIFYNIYKVKKNITE